MIGRRNSKIVYRGALPHKEKISPATFHCEVTAAFYRTYVRLIDEIIEVEPDTFSRESEAFKQATTSPDSIDTRELAG